MGHHFTEADFYYLLGGSAALILLLLILCAFLFRLYQKEKDTRKKMHEIDPEKVIVEVPENSPPAVRHEYINPGYLPDNEKEPSNRKHYYTETVTYSGRIVAVKRVAHKRRLSFERSIRRDSEQQIFSLNDEHVCKFYGLNYEKDHITILTEYCSRGSLKDLLKHKSHWNWDDVFKHSLILDIIRGMKYVHQSPTGSHGKLKPSNCLIDSRFVVKLTDFGILGHKWRPKKDSETSVQEDYLVSKLYSAPELLRHGLPPLKGTKKGDVYSFAIVTHEVLYQSGVFYRKSDSLPPSEIINKISFPAPDQEPFRPSLEDNDYVIIDTVWRSILARCWNEKAEERLDFDTIFKETAQLQKQGSLVDNLLQRLQKYSNHLEEKVVEQTEVIEKQKEKSDNLLYQMLPKSVADTLKRNRDVMPEHYEDVTIYFSDIVGFSAICHRSEPLEVVQMLNDLYTMFDEIVDGFDVYKVETIGDAYMVVSGLPIRNGKNHAREIARMAIRLRDCVCNDFKIQHLPDEKLKLRIGIHTGPVVAGVVGQKMPRYCLFGDTVNTAARMEQSGKELQIHISSQTKDVLERFGNFEIKGRDETVSLKGLGEWSTWWLCGEVGNSHVKHISYKRGRRLSHQITGATGRKRRSGVLSTTRRASVGFIGEGFVMLEEVGRQRYLSQSHDRDSGVSLPYDESEFQHISVLASSTQMGKRG